jgi:uncharacterized protein (TIGR02246 family)
MSRIHSAAAGAFLSLLFVLSASAPAAEAGGAVNFAGDTREAAAVWQTFRAWLRAYRSADLAGTMAIFDPAVVFAFQGQKDQSFKDLEDGYRSAFAGRKPDVESEWVPHVDEIYAEGRTAFVRSIWELRVREHGGAAIAKARNRSIDVLRRGEDGRWRIFRSLNYPEKGS